MLTKTQVNHIVKAKRTGNGGEFKLSDAQIEEMGRLSLLAISLLAGLAASMPGKMLGLGVVTKGGREL